MNSERFKNEICQNGNLTDYEKIIDFIIKEINLHDCNISCCYNFDTSRIEQSKINGHKKSHIRISLKNKREKPIHIIFDMLHEFGHFLSGVPIKNTIDINREIIAWDFALKVLRKIPESSIYFDEFYIYRDFCLNTYRTN